MNINHGIILRSFNFAKASHSRQQRKYTCEPYIVHPVSVARLVGEICRDPLLLSACMLHDVLEDTDVKAAELRARFGFEVSEIVESVSDVSRAEDGNRKVRKQKDLSHLKQSGPMAQTLKLADLADNSLTIDIYDRKFAAVFNREAVEIVRELTLADDLLRRAVGEYLSLSLSSRVRIAQQIWQRLRVNWVDFLKLS